ncbi:hypothetical protein DC522_16260 [Microvirga sp. KLBC 81]|nr:hypothetical protein DC522_16260 [Microvirga sp. KLBC 81]
MRVRAYHIWERQGRTAIRTITDEAERDLTVEETAGTSQNHPEATVEEATPVESVEAAQAATAGSADDKDSSGS